MSDLAVIFAGGGTGGHIYPALAILQSLEQQLETRPKHLFVCSDRPLDSEILTREGVEHLAVPASPFATKPRGLLRLMRSWGPSVRAGRSAIRRLRADGRKVCVVAMGGFVAPPIVQAARAERSPALLVNLDAVPGRANRWIARHAARVLSVHGAGGHESIPPIVRTQARWNGSKQDARRALGLDADTPTLLITGGSQGASTVDEMMIAFCAQHRGSLASWQILHQARPENAERVADAYASAVVPSRVVTFVDNMGAAWGSADLALARSGAGGVAEVWANRVPAIFMPFPGHADEHQRLNAMPLSEAGACVLVTDKESPARNLEVAGKRLVALLENPKELLEMALALAALGPADGADYAARAIIDLAC